MECNDSGVLSEDCSVKGMKWGLRQCEVSSVKCRVECKV